MLAEYAAWMGRLRDGWQSECLLVAFCREKMLTDLLGKMRG